MIEAFGERMERWFSPWSEPGGGGSNSSSIAGMPSGGGASARSLSGQLQSPLPAAIDGTQRTIAADQLNEEAPM